MYTGILFMDQWHPTKFFFASNVIIFKLFFTIGNHQSERSKDEQHKAIIQVEVYIHTKNKSKVSYYSFGLLFNFRNLQNHSIYQRQFATIPILLQLSASAKWHLKTKDKLGKGIDMRRQVFVNNGASGKS